MMAAVAAASLSRSRRLPVPRCPSDNAHPHAPPLPHVRLPCAGSERRSTNRRSIVERLTGHGEWCVTGPAIAPHALGGEPCPRRAAPTRPAGRRGCPVRPGASSCSRPPRRSSSRRATTPPRWTTSPSGPASPSPCSTSTFPASSSSTWRCWTRTATRSSTGCAPPWRRARDNKERVAGAIQRLLRLHRPRERGVPAGLRVGPAQRPGRAGAGRAGRARLRRGDHRDDHGRHRRRPGSGPNCSRPACAARPRSRPGSGWPAAAQVPKAEAEALLATLSWRGIASFPLAGRARHRRSDSLRSGRRTRDARVGIARRSVRGGQDRRSVRATASWCWRARSRPPRSPRPSTEALANDAGVLTLVDEKGRRVIVPVAKLAYVEIAEAQPRKVGFTAS